MELKQVASRLYYCVEEELTLPEIPQFAEKNADSIFKDAESKGLGIVGPLEFIYLNCVGDPTKPFQLIIAVPVKEKKPSGNDFFFMETVPFDCMTMDYKGPMENIGSAWESLTIQVLDTGYKLTNQGREVYKEWISFESEENITELQVGILAKKII